MSLPSEPLQFPDHWKIFAPRDDAQPASKPIATVPSTKILVAEDDAVSRELITARLEKWGYEPVVTTNGYEAMGVLSKPDGPRLALVDWMMPGMDGLEVCRKVRESAQSAYIILLTSRGAKEDLVEALQAGADDYVVKPFERDELHARIKVGLRIIALQTELQKRIKELEEIANSSRGAGFGL